MTSFLLKIELWYEKNKEIKETRTDRQKDGQKEIESQTDRETETD
jgi:hypothetical protein